MGGGVPMRPGHNPPLADGGNDGVDDAYYRSTGGLRLWTQDYVICKCTSPGLKTPATANEF